MRNIVLRIRAAATSLARGHCPLRYLCGDLKQSLLLDLAGLQCDFGDVKAEILPHFNSVKLCAVESPQDSFQRAHRSSMGRLFVRRSHASSATGALDPHEVPTRLADHGIENRCGDLSYKVPVVAYRFHHRLQTTRQDAPAAQKNRMYFHACALLGIAWPTSLQESEAITMETASSPFDASFFGDSPTDRPASGCEFSGSTFERPVASGRIAFTYKILLLRRRCERWFATSHFLMTLMTTPVVRLRLNGALLERSVQCRRQEGNTTSHSRILLSQAACRSLRRVARLAFKHWSGIREHLRRRCLISISVWVYRKGYAVPFETA